MSNKKHKPYQRPSKQNNCEFLPPGFNRVHGMYGKAKVYKNGKLYISPDIDQHNGGYWKVAKTIDRLWSKKTRLGTYDKYLTRRLGD